MDERDGGTRLQSTAHRLIPSILQLQHENGHAGGCSSDPKNQEPDFRQGSNGESGISLADVRSGAKLRQRCSPLDMPLLKEHAAAFD
jgi:hypothetical protein